MPDLPVLRAGIWRHYTNHLYLVLGYAHDSTNGVVDRTVVVYVGLDLDGAQHGERMLVREVDEFFDIVDPRTGELVDDVSALDGGDPAPVERFTYVGPTVPAADLSGRTDRG